MALNTAPTYLTSVKATDQWGNEYPINVRFQKGSPIVLGYPVPVKRVRPDGKVFFNHDGVELTIPDKEIEKLNKFCS